MKNVAEIYPLAPLQQLMLTQAVARRDRSLLVEQFQCNIDGSLDPRLLRAAAERTVAKHPLLRACFAWEKLKKPVQIVREQVAVPWFETDFRELPAAEQTSAVATLLTEDKERGFDLTKAPLVRFHLIRTAERQWLFAWTCHHLIVDGWSAAVVLKDLFVEYERSRQQLPDLQEPAGSFGEYLKWLQSRDPAQADRFWAEHLAGMYAPSTVPALKLQQDDGTAIVGEGRSELHLDAATTAQLNQLALRQRVGLNTLVQAAWGILLSRANSTDDVLLGVAVSGRPPEVPQVESIVGPLLNNIPLRMRIDPSVGLPELFAQLQQLQAETQSFEYVEVGRICQAAGLSRDCRPFDSLLVFENYPLSTSGRLQIGEFQVSNLSGSASSTCALTLIVVPNSELELRLLYDLQRYSDPDARRILRFIEILLRAFVSQPEAKLRDLALIDGQDLDTLRAAAKRSPDRVLDCSGQIAALGLAGEIWTVVEPAVSVRHTNRQMGQLRPDPLSANATPLRATGYRGVVHPTGEIEWRGRIDAPTVVDGHGVDPREITAILCLHPLVAQGMVVARTESNGSEQLAAFVVPTSAANSAVDSGQYGLLLEQLTQFIADRVPQQLVPRIWRVLPSLPMLADGGIDVEALPTAFRPRGESPQQYVAPIDALESRLCAIWSEVLGVDPVGVDDDFLDLGGHSSLAVALATRLEREFGRRLSLAALLERPTVGQLALLLRQPALNAEELALVPIRPTGSTTPLFCVHPAGGTVLCYVELARHLDPDLPVFGLQAQGIDDALEPLASITEMAASYVAAIKTAQPSGPYRLCGWSTGGVIAYEMAHQLAASGDKVELLALLDAAIPAADAQFGADDVLPLLEMLFPGEKLQALEGATPEQQLEAFRSRAERAMLVMNEATSTQAARIYRVFQANMQAVAEFRPGPISVPLTLIRAAQQATPMHNDPHLGWNAWAEGGIDLRTVDCTHMNMLQPPAVQSVAQILTESLALILA